MADNRLDFTTKFLSNDILKNSSNRVCDIILQPTLWSPFPRIHPTVGFTHLGVPVPVL